MLSPDYLDRCADETLGMSDELSTSLAAAVGISLVSLENLNSEKAISKAAAQLQEESLRRYGSFRTSLDAALQDAFYAAGKEDIRAENARLRQHDMRRITRLTPRMKELLENAYQDASGDLLNLTRTTVSTSQSLFVEAANRAFLQVKSGSASYTDALTEAVKSAARQGTTVLFDAAGPTQLDVAMRRAVLTGVNQAAASVTLAYADEVECDYVETTAHAGARPTHVLWQGQVFCISGRDTGYRKFAEATGYGKVDGLCGVNCRHNFYMFWPGISVPVYTQEQLQAYTAASIPWQGQMLTEAEARAMQRAREVRIRESKRTLAVLDAAAQSTNDAALKAALQAEFAKEARLLDRRQASLQEFCAATKRRMDTTRTQVHAITAPDGRIISFDRALARKAADVV